MRAKPVSRLTNRVLLARFEALLRHERGATVELLGVLGEIDARKLYLPAGYPSMHAYSVHVHHLSEDAAYKRIHAARAVRRFPLLRAAIAEGRLHLSAVCLLTPHLRPSNVEAYVAAATHKTKRQVEEFLAGEKPRPDMPERIEKLAPVPVPMSAELAPGQVAPPATSSISTVSDSGATGSATSPLAPGQVAGPALPEFAAPPPAPRPRITPLAPERYALQLTMNKETHDLLRQAQDLLRHRIPNGDAAHVLGEVLKLAIPILERQRFAATSRPRKPGTARRSKNPRHIPAAIQREVWARDGARCTFVSASGHRCEATGNLEFDHVRPVSRGGTSTPANLRLLCRAHNQYAAGEALGHGFMHEKRTRGSGRNGAPDVGLAGP